MQILDMEILEEVDHGHQSSNSLDALCRKIRELHEVWDLEQVDQILNVSPC